MEQPVNPSFPLLEGSAPRETSHFPPPQGYLPEENRHFPCGARRFARGKSAFSSSTEPFSRGKSAFSWGKGRSRAVIFLIGYVRKGSRCPSRAPWKGLGGKANGWLRQQARKGNRQPARCLGNCSRRSSEVPSANPDFRRGRVIRSQRFLEPLKAGLQPALRDLDRPERGTRG